MNLALIGLRCAGKTTIGRLVSARLGWPFIDLDDMVRRAFHQRSIREIWLEHGEQSWRDGELKCLRTALKQHRHVIALGGGVPMIDDAAELISAARKRRTLRVVYLQCSARELERRRHADGPDDRPPLEDESIAQEIARTMRERDRTYHSLADCFLDGTTQSAEEAADRLVQWMMDKG